MTQIHINFHTSPHTDTYHINTILTTHHTFSYANKSQHTFLSNINLLLLQTHSVHLEINKDVPHIYDIFVWNLPYTYPLSYLSNFHFEVTSRFSSLNLVNSSSAFCSVKHPPPRHTHTWKGEKKTDTVIYENIPKAYWFILIPHRFLLGHYPRFFYLRISRVDLQNCRSLEILNCTRNANKNNTHQR